MKKTQKKVLGLLGLSLVAGMTAAAAMIPTPGAIATSGASNTVVLRVVGNEATLSFDADRMSTATSNPNYWIYANYQNVENLNLSVKNMTTGNVYNIANVPVSLESGTLERQTNFLDYGGNYGEYYYTLTGTGPVGGGEVYWTVNYYPVVLEQQENGNFEINVGNNSSIRKIVVSIRGRMQKADGSFENYESSREYQNGDVVTEISDLPKGEYEITVIAYDENGNEIYRGQTIDFTSLNPPAAGTTPETPDTGSFFHGLNIASEDFLATGIAVFFVISVVAIGIVARGKGNVKNLKKRH